MQCLIRTYTVWELIYQIWDQQTANMLNKKKKKKKRRTRRLHLVFCSRNVFTRVTQMDWLSDLPALVAQLDALSDWRPGDRGFNPRKGRQHSFVGIHREIFSRVILSLPLIQEGQLSVSGERMCTILVSLATRPIYKYVCHFLFTYYYYFFCFFHLHSTFWFNI